MKTLGHIDVISKYFYPVTAGIETNILETYSELVRLGWSVTVHTTTDTLNTKDVLPHSDTVRGISVLRYKANVFGFSPRINYASTDLVCLHNFNIFPHLTIYLHAIILRFLGRRIPNIFLTPHGGFTPEWPTFLLPQRMMKRLYHRIIGRFLINTQTAKVRAISEWEQQMLINEGVNPSKIVLIKNGLDRSAMRNHSKEASRSIKRTVGSLGKYVVAIGRIAPIKNYETMIKSLINIPVEISLVIIGPTQDDIYFKGLQKMAKDLGVSRRVKYLGTLRGADKYYVIQKALCQIHLARWESFCNVVYEAKSLSQICIVANNTALTSLIQNNLDGFIIDTFDYRMLAEVIKKIANPASRHLLLDIRKRLQEEKYPTWDVSAKKMHDYYKHLVK